MDYRRRPRYTGATDDICTVVLAGHACSEQEEISGAPAGKNDDSKFFSFPLVPNRLEVLTEYAAHFAARGRAIRELRQSFTELQRISKKTLVLLREILRPKPLPLQKVTTGRIEIERNGEVAYLEYSLSGNILELIHTAVPKRLRGMGLASSLAETALHWARNDKLKVDIICPSVQAYLVRHPEYSDLVMH